jgi:outer membrane lipoprotein-sorting protein
MTALIALAVLAGAPKSYTWQDIVQPNFRDCTFVAEIVKANESELKKISKDFAASFRFMSAPVKAEVKEPFMVRLESRLEGTDLQVIENEGRTLYKIPKLGIKKVQDLSHAPGKQQTVLDFGVLTASLFEQRFDATFVREDRETGGLVFDLTYKHPLYNDTTRQRVWVDPQKRYVIKRVWFAQDGHEMATFLYNKPMEESGVWFPSEAVVKNVDGAIAGITRYSKMNINVGLTTKPFQF